MLGLEEPPPNKMQLTDVKEDLLKDFSITMTKEQESGAEQLLAGIDVVAAMPTGSGKSLIFQSLTYSAVKRGEDIVTLIVTPLKAISYNHIETFRRKFGIKCLDAGTAETNEFTSRDFSAIVAQPEVLVGPKGKLILEALGDRCSLFVIDEAHCLKTWGGGDRPFRKNFRDLSHAITKLKNRPVVLCLTATLTEVAEKLTLKSLGLNPETVHKIVENPVSARLSFYNTENSLNISPLIERLNAGNCPRVIIFESSLVQCGQRYLDFAQELAAIKRKDLIDRVEVFHSQIPDSKQQEISSSLMTPDGRILIVIATSALSMGFDAVGVEYIVHVQMTRTLEDFIQMSGRAGRRDNVRAYCILFTKKKTRGMEKCCELYRKQQDKCRRKLLSEYFNGDVRPHSNSSNHDCCDICSPCADDLVLELTSSASPSGQKELSTCRRVCGKDKNDCEKALKDQQLSYMNEMPFLDLELTSGIISLVCDNLHKLKSKEDLATLVPYLSQTVIDDIMIIVNDIFDV